VAHGSCTTWRTISISASRPFTTVIMQVHAGVQALEIVAPFMGIAKPLHSPWERGSLHYALRHSRHRCRGCVRAQRRLHQRAGGCRAAAVGTGNRVWYHAPPGDPNRMPGSAVGSYDGSYDGMVGSAPAGASVPWTRMWRCRRGPRAARPQRHPRARGLRRARHR
jgi:hypothetical protein